MGQRVIQLERRTAQSAYASYRENVRWTVGDVVFLTLSLPGSNNNRGTDTMTAPVEFTERNAANLAWLRDGFIVMTVDPARRTCSGLSR